MRFGLPIATLTLGLSLAIHSLVLVSFEDDSPPRAIEGASPGLAALGNSFADMVTGTPEQPIPSEPQKAEQPEETQEREVEETQKVEAQETEETLPEKTTQADRAEKASPKTPQKIAEAQVIETLEQNTELVEIATLQPVEAPRAVDTDIPTQPVQSTDAPKVATSHRPILSVAPQPSRPLQTVPFHKSQSEQLVNTAEVASVQASLEKVRPVQNAPKPQNTAEASAPPETSLPRRLPTHSEPHAEPVQQTRAQQPQTQFATQATGNGSQNTRSGQAAASAETGVQSTGEGSTRGALTRTQAREATRWEKLVFARILRARRELPRARALAVVDLRINPQGGIASVSIHKSSGNADFDSLALNHVRRSGPFPPPPRGARTRLGIELEGKR